MPKFAAIEDALQAYFDMLYTADPELMRHVFHPRAVYATADVSPARIYSVDEYAEILRKREAPAASNAPREDHIDRVEFIGENTALAKVRCRIGDQAYVDVLSFIKQAGTWQLIAKIFHMP